MCRNIRTLFNFEPPATDEELHDAALQYVRKISGMRKPSQVNRESFDRAVDKISKVSRDLMDQLVTDSRPRDREVERARARERWQKRAARVQSASG